MFSTIPLAFFCSLILYNIGFGFLLRPRRPSCVLQVKYDSVYMQVFLWRALAPQSTDSRLTWIELPYFKWAPSLSDPEQWRFKTHIIYLFVYCWSIEILCFTLWLCLLDAQMPNAACMLQITLIFYNQALNYFLKYVYICY